MTWSVSIYTLGIYVYMYIEIDHSRNYTMSKNETSLTTKKTNIDTDYNRQVKHFSQNYKQLPTKKKHLKQLLTKYDTYARVPLTELSTTEITQFRNLKNEIDQISKEIEQIEQHHEVTDFYLKTGELLMDYYDSFDPTSTSIPSPSGLVSSITNTKNYDVPQTPVFSSPTPISTSTSKTGRASMPSIQQFFKPTKTTQSVVVPVTKRSIVRRADLYEQYLTQTDPHHMTIPEPNKIDELCPQCGIQRELLASEAIMVCPKCGDEVQTIMESDKPSYHDPPHENMYFAYKRINHFKEQLAHFQAKETTKIPQEIYDVILVEFKKEKKTNLASLTRTQVKKYLQKYAHLGFNKYYENINQIICHLNGIQPFTMRPEVEEQLCNMFLRIQEPFDKHCPPGRTNFLSYSFVIYKCCQLLGYIEYLPYFNLLKSRDKLRQQDKIWKNICLDLKWKYYPSS